MKEIRDRQEFESLIASEKGTCALFTADWCPDCQVLKPVLPELEKEFAESFDFVSLNRDRFIDLCGEMNIFGIPSFVTFRGGSETDRFVSTRAKSREELASFLRKTGEL
jgi:thiol-disulfide isomerase/thioredoxin